jgi:hypothetical protein
MPITIEVLRGEGARDGGEIRDPLLGDSLPAALARGRAELDTAAHASDRVVVSLDYRPDLMLGQRVEVSDAELGATWQGDLVGLLHTWDGRIAETRAEIDRPRGEDDG